MSFLLLLPAIFAVFLIATRSLGDALIDVYLPTLLLVPMYYEFTIPHTINIGAATAALLPITIVTLIKYGSRWRFQRSDIWILLFLLGIGVSNGKAEFTIGLREAFEASFITLLPYVTGKLLIEQEGLRERFVRRLCWLMAVVAVLSIVEFRLGKNLFSSFFSFFFSNAPMEQLRGSFTRAQGPFGHSITAGTVFAAAWILSLWLSYVDKLRLGASERKIFGIRLSMILVGLVFFGLLVARSRGPWIGAGLAFVISRIGTARNVRRTTILIGLSLAVAGIAGYQYTERYTDPSLYDTASQDQQNAIYRRMLLDVYQPVVAVGGFFGWGVGFPRVGGQASIDNEYLWLRLTQGTFGLYLFILISLETMASLIASARRAREKSDFYFRVTILAVLAGILFTGTTVETADQAYVIFFLCVGLGFSIRPAQANAGTVELSAVANASRPRIFA